MKIDPFLFGTQRCTIDTKASKAQIQRLQTALYWPHTIRSLLEFMVGRKEHNVDIGRLTPESAVLAYMEVLKQLRDKLRISDDALYGFPVERIHGVAVLSLTSDKKLEAVRGLF